MYFGEKEFAALHDSRIWAAYQANTLSIYTERGIWWYEKMSQRSLGSDCPGADGRSLSGAELSGRCGAEPKDLKGAELCLLYL